MIFFHAESDYYPEQVEKKNFKLQKFDGVRDGFFREKVHYFGHYLPSPSPLLWNFSKKSSDLVAGPFPKYSLCKLTKTHRVEVTIHFETFNL